MSQCPDKYSQDRESAKLCSLWAELQALLAAEDTDETVDTTGVSPLLVVCVFRENPTSSTLLCQLWCEIQTFRNKVIFVENQFSQSVYAMPVLFLIYFLEPHDNLG